MENQKTEQHLTDEQLCEQAGITLDQVAKQVDQIESGDYSAFDFTQVIYGQPDQIQE